MTEAFPRLRRVLRDDLDASERAALASWLSFTTTFAAVRGITYSIRAGNGPFHNISAGGEHLHHYLWGICMLAGVGAVAVHGEERHRSHPAIATAYGSGLALIVDEFALLLDLKDVYWAKQARVSVDLGVGCIAGTGSYFAMCRCSVHCGGAVWTSGACRAATTLIPTGTAGPEACRARRVAGGWSSYSPTWPPASSATMSRWPRCRAYSCTR